MRLLWTWVRSVREWQVASISGFVQRHGRLWVETFTWEYGLIHHENQDIYASDVLLPIVLGSNATYWPLKTMRFCVEKSRHVWCGYAVVNNLGRKFVNHMWTNIIGYITAEAEPWFYSGWNIYFTTGNKGGDCPGHTEWGASIWSYPKSNSDRPESLIKSGLFMSYCSLLNNNG